MQLCVFERNFIKAEECSKTAQEALVATKSERARQEGKNMPKLRKGDACNYFKLKDHWIRREEKWPRRPSKTTLYDMMKISAAEFGSQVSEAHPCIYIHERKSRKLLIVLYVNDGLIAAIYQLDFEMFTKELKAKFKISVGETSCFLDLEIESI
ncbi:hypothetical protein NPIL_605191 [Nephila pilipes]|uniref:Uncharacterized protein n=1 Tax=Nephila pilipes TaxID=299642 RepID=A0A8X6QCK4_NEPPI|nr:hypothetical protein NPIL_605191 [Nephila pilipes]